MNDRAKTITEAEKTLRASQRAERKALARRSGSRRVSAQDAADRTHAEFPETIKYLGR